MPHFDNSALRGFGCLFPDGKACCYSNQNIASIPGKALSHQKESLCTHSHILPSATIFQ